MLSCAAAVACLAHWVVWWGEEDPWQPLALGCGPPARTFWLHTLKRCTLWLWLAPSAWFGSYRVGQRLQHFAASHRVYSLPWRTWCQCSKWWWVLYKGFQAISLLPQQAVAGRWKTFCFWDESNLSSEYTIICRFIIQPSSGYWNICLKECTRRREYLFQC